MTELRSLKLICFSLVLTLLFACGGNGPEETLDVSTTEIDTYVSDKLSESQEYDVTQSLRFAHDTETYEVIEYMQNDTVVLFMEIHYTDELQTVRQTFFKEGLPVYVDELLVKNVLENPFTQRKTYLNGADVIESYERYAENETDLEYMEYAEVDIDWESFDFQRPADAIHQEGEFKMQFGEFIIIDPQTYLILENESGYYDVALFVSEPHPLIDQLNGDPESYEGQTIFVNHQFVLMNGIERMLFIDGELKE